MTAHARAAGRDLDALHAWLARHGVEVRRHGGGMKYHAKYLVADEQLAVVTTFNCTARCFTRTCDFTLVSRDAAVVSGTERALCRGLGPAVRLLHDCAAGALDRRTDHGPRERFAALVREAARRVRLLDAKLSDPEIVALLDERQRSGIRVETARRRDVRPLRRHGKLLIVDDTVAVLGSLALSARALDERRELAIVIREPRLVAELDAFWRTHVLPYRHVAPAAATAEPLELAS